MLPDQYIDGADLADKTQGTAVSAETLLVSHG